MLFSRLDEIALGVAVAGGGVGQGGAGQAPFGVEVDGDGPVEFGQLLSESLVGKAEGVDAAGEGLVGAAAGDSHRRPVGVELVACRRDGLGPPFLGLVERVDGGLMALEPFDLMGRHWPGRRRRRRRRPGG